MGHLPWQMWSWSMSVDLMLPAAEKIVLVLEAIEAWGCATETVEAGHGPAMK
jgi:hypothetical protein